MLTNGSNNGILIGQVSDLKDPEQLGRVRVTFPIHNDQPSAWARLATVMAGANRGVFFRPEVGDEVLVAFEQADPRRPYILGGVWSKVDAPPPDDGDTEQNNWRFIRSRSGHILKFDDTEGAERFEIEGKSRIQRVVVDDSGRKVSIQADEGDIEITAGQGHIEIAATQANVVIKATKVQVEAQQIEVKGETMLKVQAPQVEFKADAQMTIDGGTNLTLKAAMVKIN